MSQVSYLIRWWCPRYADKVGIHFGFFFRQPSFSVFIRRGGMAGQTHALYMLASSQRRAQRRWWRPMRKFRKRKRSRTSRYRTYRTATFAFRIFFRPLDALTQNQRVHGETDNTNIQMRNTHIFAHSGALRSTPEAVANPIMAGLQRPSGPPLFLTLCSISTRNGIAWSIPRLP